MLECIIWLSHKNRIELERDEMRNKSNLVKESAHRRNLKDWSQVSISNLKGMQGTWKETEEKENLIAKVDFCTALKIGPENVDINKEDTYFCNNRVLTRWKWHSLGCKAREQV